MGRRRNQNSKSNLSVVVVAVFVVVVVLVSLMVSVPYFSGVSLSPLPRNVVLFYDDYPQKGDPTHQINAATVGPLIAYVDLSSKPSAFMFDGIIIYNVYLFWSNWPTQQTVSSYMSYMFNGSQVANLDNEVGLIKQQLGADPNYKMFVYLTVPVIYPNGTAYVNHYGKYVNVANMKQNIDVLVASWNKLSPKNLNLVGFYWGFTEAPWDSVDTLISGSAAPYVHSKGLKLLMIPYRSTSNLVNWPVLHSLGVDLVSGQPNFHLDTASNETDFSVVNVQLQAGNIDGVHLETPLAGNPVTCCGGNATSNAQIYYRYAFQYQWYRNRMNTYYQGSAFSTMATSADPHLRGIYDLIYSFIQATRTGVVTTVFTNTVTNTVISTSSNVPVTSTMINMVTVTSTQTSNVLDSQMVILLIVGFAVALVIVVGFLFLKRGVPNRSRR